MPDELRSVLRRLLAQRPEERYQTPAALLEALGEEEPTGLDALAEPEAEPVPARDTGDALSALVAGADERERVEEAPPRKPPYKKPMRRRDDPEEEDEAGDPPYPR